MKKIFFLPVVIPLFFCCTNTEKITKQDNRIALRGDTVNVVKLTDTLVIFESTCRGCAFEGSTRFAISDSLDMIKLENVITTDNNRPDVAGGNISKTLVLVPVKNGLTTIKMYKFWKGTPTPEDSALYRAYTIEVRN